MLWDGQDPGRAELALFEKLKGAIRLFERESLDLCSNRDVGRESQEVYDVLSGAVGDASDSPLLIEQGVVKLRDRAHGDPGDSYRAAFPQDPERLRDQTSSGREDDRAIEPAWGIVLGAAGPVGTKLSRKGVMRFAPGKDKDLASPVDRDLDGDVG